MKVEGVAFKFDGELGAMRGTLFFQLTIWVIGGFKALSSAFRHCQYCIIVETDLQIKVRTTCN